ncbi:hypothetical protein SLA_3205 [Streptomyces laurentii]|uniref:Uncharacterized protein n=1 Tax=Streptomyces laurentii TaxID=39478 RepID=A0A160NYV2_STRLU|nr:hypothetical protein SLA_3205 [Streptomyces laurentii]
MRPVCAGSVCVLAPGRSGSHRDRAGDAWWVTPELADAVTVSLLTHALMGLSEPALEEPEFRSPRCVVGRHDHCRDGVARDSGVPGVRYLVCGCVCHGRSISVQ